MKLLILALPLLLCGCTSPSSMLKQLKNDPATVDITIANPVYGTVIFHRSYPTNWIGVIKGP
jgi:starvation-inducible outer membrane lipoprotein